MSDPQLSDPLAQIVGLLQPDLSYSKLVEGAGPWRVRRSEQGRPFFSALLDGTILLEVHDREPITVRTGDFVLIPAAYDFTASSTQPAPAPDADDIPVELRPNLFRFGDPDADPEVRMLIGYCAFGSSDAALLVTLLPSLVHVRGEDRLATLVQLAATEARGDRPARDVILARLMEVLFIEALRAAGPYGPSGLLRGLGDGRLSVALRQMHAAPTSPWTVAILARKAGMSRSAFFEHFRRVVGQTPMDYLQRWRMVLAKDLLKRRGGSIAEIAGRVGYGSASTFSVAFTRHVGMPPARYARQAE